MSLSAHQLFDLFDEAAFAPERWPIILDQASAVLGASMFALLRLRAQGGDILAVEEKARPHAELYEPGEWWRHDLRALRSRTAPRMALMSDDDLLAPGERQSSEFYRGFAAAVDAPYSLFWSFDVGERFFLFTALRGAAQGPATAAERRLMSEIRAKATQAAIVSAHLEEAREQGLIASLESAGMAALALDRDGAVVGATKAGQALLAAEFTQVNGALSLKESAGGPAFGALERLKADLKSSGPTTQQGAFAIDRPDKAPLLCTPLHHKTPTHQALSEVRTLLILKDLAAPAAVSGDVLTRLYRLTPAEADVARQIAAGLSVEEISRARGVAEVTTRTILRAVFRKTGACRQGELAAMLNRLV